MKHFVFLIIFASLFTSMAFASDSVGETSTDCPMMREQNERNNPKSNLEAQIKAKSKRPTATAQ